MNKITEASKKRFLDTVDDRFLELISCSLDFDIAKRSKMGVDHPKITRKALVLLARKKLKYSKRTSDEDIFQALLNTYRRSRKAA